MGVMEVDNPLFLVCVHVCFFLVRMSFLLIWIFVV